MVKKNLLDSVRKRISARRFKGIKSEVVGWGLEAEELERLEFEFESM